MQANINCNRIMMSESIEILVIGGGVIGLACAWRLARRGQSVVLLERGECGGASLASLGALWPASPLRDGPLQRLQRESLWGYAEFAAELDATTGIDPRYRRSGRLELIQDEAHRARAAAEAEAACALWPAWTHEPVMEVIPPEGIAALEPNVAPNKFGAMLCRSTAQVEPQRLIEALKAACQTSGVDIREESPARNIVIEAGRIQCVETDSKAWRPGAVITAAGAWTSRLDKSIASLAPVRPVKGQALEVSVKESLCSRIVKSGPVYIVPHGEREKLIGATTEPRAGFDENVTLAGVAQLTADAISVIPALQEAVLSRAWAGLRPQGMDRRPFIGRAPGVENLYFATGHYKIGLGLAPLTAEIVTELVMDGVTSWEISHFQPGRV